MHLVVTIQNSRLSGCKIYLYIKLKTEYEIGSFLPHVRNGPKERSQVTTGARQSLKPGDTGAPKTIDDFTKARISNEV